MGRSGRAQPGWLTNPPTSANTGARTAEDGPNPSLERPVSVGLSSDLLFGLERPDGEQAPQIRPSLQALPRCTRGDATYLQSFLGAAQGGMLAVVFHVVFVATFGPRGGALEGWGVSEEDGPLSCACRWTRKVGKSDDPKIGPSLSRNRVRTDPGAATDRPEIASGPASTLAKERRQWRR